MNNVNKTLYIPLRGKAFVSKRGLFLNDKKAEEIWEAEKFPLKGKSASKWLAYYMGIRAAVFDDWVRERLSADPDSVVIHIGCGMDSRILRIGSTVQKWYDIDFPEVITERKRYYTETNGYRMISADVRNSDWMNGISENIHAIVIMEGVSMYLTSEELKKMLTGLCTHFAQVDLLTDCYTSFAAKMSKHKNPINDVGVTSVYGIDDPVLLQHGGFMYVKEHSMTPDAYIDQLRGIEKSIFQRLYAGRFAAKLYRLYEYRKV